MSALTERVIVQIQFPKEMERAVRAAVELHHPYQMGTDKELYVRTERAGADLLVANLNLIEGVKAKLFGE